MLVGKDYTRRAGELAKLDKTYKITMCLGSKSSTGDPEGKIIPVKARIPALEELQIASQQLTGQVEQVPPSYSAIKVGGQRAYKLARAGKEVVIKPRKITINDLKIINYKYPEAHLVADVSSGTYIRTLVEDLGQALGTGAYTTALRRTQIGTFLLKEAVSVKADSLLESIVIFQGLVSGADI